MVYLLILPRTRLFTAPALMEPNVQGKKDTEGKGVLGGEGLVCAKSPPSCLTLCNPVDGSLPGSSVHGIFHARILEWVATSFPRGSSRHRDGTHVSCFGRRVLYH